MTAAKILDCIATLLGCERQPSDAVSAYTQVKNRRRLLHCGNFPSQLVQIYGIRLPRHVWPETWQSLNAYKELIRTLPCWIALGEKQFVRMESGKRLRGCACLRTGKWDYFLSVSVDDIGMAGTSTISKPMWKILMKQADLEKPTQLLRSRSMQSK